MSIAYTDFTMRIVHHTQLLLVLFVLISASFLLGFELNILASLLCLCVGFLFWKTRCVGAADVKLLASFMLALPNHQILLFLVLVSCFGFVLALLTLLFYARKDVPYAPAICGGYLVLFYWNFSVLQ